MNTEISTGSPKRKRRTGKVNAVQERLAVLETARGQNLRTSGTVVCVLYYSIGYLNNYALKMFLLEYCWTLLLLFLPPSPPKKKKRKRKRKRALKL